MYLGKLCIDFDEIFWSDGAWSKDQSFKFWQRSESVSGSWVGPDEDSDPGICGGFFGEIYGGVGHGPKDSRLEFGGDPDHSQHAGFWDPDRDQDPVIF